MLGRQWSIQNFVLIGRGVSSRRTIEKRPFPLLAYSAYTTLQCATALQCEKRLQLRQRYSSRQCGNVAGNKTFSWRRRSSLTTCNSRRAATVPAQVAQVITSIRPGNLRKSTSIGQEMRWNTKFTCLSSTFPGLSDTCTTWTGHRKIKRRDFSKGCRRLNFVIVSSNLGILIPETGKIDADRKSLSSSLLI